MGDVTTQRVWFTMARHPTGGWFRVGNAYGTEGSARSWLPFVRKAKRNCRVRVSQCTLRICAYASRAPRSCDISIFATSSGWWHLLLALIPHPLR